jgi:ribosomal protein S27E
VGHWVYTIGSEHSFRIRCPDTKVEHGVYPGMDQSEVACPTCGDLLIAPYKNCWCKAKIVRRK